METKTENTAHESVMLTQDKADKYAPENLMLYRTSISLMKSLVEDGCFTDKEYRKICTTITQKYGLSSSSIFAEKP